MTVETARLRLVPISNGELEALIAREEDPELKQAYSEMLQGCLREPEARLWHTVWYLERKTAPETVVGDLSFKGLNPDGSAELGYGLRAGCCGCGYMTEAVRAVCTWAFAQGAVRVEAETAPENTASQRVLARAGFLPTGAVGEEGPRFALFPPR